MNYTYSEVAMFKRGAALRPRDIERAIAERDPDALEVARHINRLRSDPEYRRRHNEARRKILERRNPKCPHCGK
jgi:hypothetical protein